MTAGLVSAYSAGMGIAFRKVWRDLWRQKGRTSLVILSLSVGVAAVGMIVSARELATRQLAVAAAADRPAHVLISLSSPVDDGMLDAIGRLPGVAEVEGVPTMNIRWKATRDGEWQQGRITAHDDFSNQKFYRSNLVVGEWPDDRQVGVEAGYVSKLGIPPVGSTIFFEVDGQAKSIRLSATIHDPLEMPVISQLPMFYATPGLLVELGGTYQYTAVRFNIDRFSQARAEEAVRAVEAKLNQTRVQLISSSIVDPGKPAAQEIFDAFLLILGVMGASSLVLSAFLVVNTINAILAQQVTQIGVMKTIGGRSTQIARIYLTGVTIYGALGLLAAIPLGVLGGPALANLIVGTFNVQPGPFEVAPSAFAYQIGVGLVTPLLAGLWPVWQGTRISIRQAIAAYGLGAGRYGAAWLDKAMGRLRGFPRSLTLILRNTFRRAGRLILTQVTLIAAGSTFMMVVSTQSSFDNTIAEVLGAWGFDVQLQFAGPQRFSEIESMLARQPEVVDMEMWMIYSAKASLPGETDPNHRQNIILTGVASDSRMFRPLLIVGRALRPDDGHALLLSQKLARDLGVTVGDVAEIDDGTTGKTMWTVVGVVADLTNGQRSGYVPREVLSHDVGGVGRGTILNVRVGTATEAAQEAFAQRARDLFESQGIAVTDVLTLLKFRRQASGSFAPIAGFLLLMTVFIAAVGAFSLSSTLSINVTERRREIAVMRALGASSLDVAIIFAGEGLLLGVLSWVAALPLGLLGAPPFLDALGRAFSFPMLFQFSTLGALAWLAIIVILSLVASWVPAHNAMQFSVREGLVYE